MMDVIQKVRDFLLGRQIAYLQVFNFDDQNVQRILADLAKFCRANESTFHEDPRVHALLEGRREVFLRLVYHLKLPPEEFLKLYAKIDTRKEYTDE